jgi:hypothetical protein
MSSKNGIPGQNSGRERSMWVHACMGVGEEEGRVWREGRWGRTGAVSGDMACSLGVGRRRSQCGWQLGEREKGRSKNTGWSVWCWSKVGSRGGGAEGKGEERSQQKRMGGAEAELVCVEHIEINMY